MNHYKLAIIMSALGLSLVACSSSAPARKPTIFQNSIQVAESIERLELYTRPNGLELSARDQLAVSQFLENYGRRGDGPIYINIPSQAASGLGAQQAQNIVRQNLASMGLAGAGVQTGHYHSVHGAPAPVVVSYRTLKAVPQDCRTLGNLAYTHVNQPYDGFGCSQSANLAAMIDDPRQLLDPYEMGTPDSQRRQTIYDKYIKGENPASDHPDRQEVAADDQ